MGNQVTTLGQIYPVEYYLADYCNDFTLVSSLGSTRFMKVARVKHKDSGYCVTKVYPINDPTLYIDEYRQKLELIKETINRSSELNALPFVQCLVNEKSIILLRQYVKYNLYDRLSTRPFLTSIEKRWIAYQLLRSIQSLHRQTIYHGDIKSENVLVTSFLWVTLADFASYKPVVLPENNPSYFSYFFDTSRRHCCNMAPERFVESMTVPSDSEGTDNCPSYTGDVDVNQLTPQMDLFSLGCVLAELFCEDSSNSTMFDLGQILMFKKQKYDPSKFVEDGITDPRIRRLILNLTDLDPGKRNSASYHLEQLVPSLFPGYFQTLYNYFAKLIPMSPDLKIVSLNKDLDKLMDEIITEDERGLLLPLILITSTLRSLKSTDTKLAALRLCIKLVESSTSIMSDYTLDRLLPYIIHLLGKSEPRVRAMCVISLASVLKHVNSLQPSDANVFIDYILPSLMPLVHDTSTLVRISLASSIADLAEMSKKFLDQSEVDHTSKLSSLQEAFGGIVSQLLVDQVNNVRRALLDENLSKLCDFFGSEKTDEVILSHIITFLNDKNDFRLRAAFFDNISQISARLGPYYTPVVKPFMQRGLSDSEEIVIYKCLNAISSMVRLELLTKDVVYELFQEAIPLLSFPNKWIRNAVINFVMTLMQVDNSTDFNKRVLPAIKLHLNRDVQVIRDELILLDSLQQPLPRAVIESICNGDDIDNIFSRIDKSSEYKLIDSELLLRRMHKNKRTATPKTVEPHLSVRRQDAIIHLTPDVDSKTPASTSKLRPRGILLAHLHEHKSAVNKLISIPGSDLFISCSNDAKIKFWDCADVATRPQVLFRSKQTFISPDAGAVTTISTCLGCDTLLALTDTNNLHLIQLNSPSSQSRLIKSINFSSDICEPEFVTTLVSLSPFTYATCSTNSNLRGYDVRLPTNSDVWNLKMDGGDGLITCLDGNEFCIACGTSSSIIAMFDLRFYIRSTTMSYPPYQDKVKKRIRQLLISNNEIYCSVVGNNEVSTWECESSTRTRTLWASSAPCLSSTQLSPHSVLSILVDSEGVITAGDDMRIRYWDLNSPSKSYIMSQPPPNKYCKWSAKQAQQKTSSASSINYQTKLVDGIQVIQETDISPPNTSSGIAHHDSISSLATVQSNLLLSGSRDGVIKIWR